MPPSGSQPIFWNSANNAPAIPCQFRGPLAEHHDTESGTRRHHRIISCGTFPKSIWADPRCRSNMDPSRRAPWPPLLGAEPCRSEAPAPFRNGAVGLPGLSRRVPIAGVHTNGHESAAPRSCYATRPRAAHLTAAPLACNLKEERAAQRCRGVEPRQESRTWHPAAARSLTSGDCCMTAALERA